MKKSIDTRHGAGKGDYTMEFKIPEPMKLEHEELHAELVKATKEKGKIGEAAKAVAKVLHNHFVKEEEYAIPPLGLLTQLAEGKVTEEMREVLQMTDKLKAELPEMLAEHKEIVAALENLITIAKKKGKRKYVRFAEKLMLHAKTEEGVSYPTAILVGEYIKMKLHVYVSQSVGSAFSSNHWAGRWKAVQRMPVGFNPLLGCHLGLKPEGVLENLQCERREKETCQPSTHLNGITPVRGRSQTRKRKTSSCAIGGLLWI
jgi:hemerythrin superfamily protein